MILNKHLAFLAVFFFVASPFSVFAHVNVDTNEKNFAPAISAWTEYGASDVLSDGRIRIESTGSRDGYVSSDADVSSRYEDGYAVFVSFARAEQPYAAFSSGAENIAGLPYLYGYFLDEDGNVTEYFTQSSMRQQAHDGSYWQVVYGYAPIPNDAESVRMFLKQASRNGVTPDGRDAWFYKPGLYFVDDANEAGDVIDAYRDELDEVADEFDGHATHASYDADEDTDYPVGTLLKCSGEPDVYSMTSSNTLKRFPNEETFYSWGHSFADVRTISCSTLDDYRVSGTWTYDRADYLVKFHGQPAVFTLDNGQYLRLIPDEYTARRMFGSDWANDIREYSAGDMGDYSYGVPHRSLR